VVALLFVVDKMQRTLIISLCCCMFRQFGVSCIDVTLQLTNLMHASTLWGKRNCHFIFAVRYGHIVQYWNITWLLSYHILHL